MSLPGLTPELPRQLGALRHLYRNQGRALLATTFQLTLEPRLLLVLVFVFGPRHAAIMSSAAAATRIPF
jgi:hypothetical protein